MNSLLGFQSLTYGYAWPLRIGGIPALSVTLIGWIALRHRLEYELELAAIFGLLFCFFFPFYWLQILNALFNKNLAIILGGRKTRKEILAILIKDVTLLSGLASTVCIFGALSGSQTKPTIAQAAVNWIGVSLIFLMLGAFLTVLFLKIRNTFVTFLSLVASLTFLYLAAEKWNPPPLSLLSPAHLAERALAGVSLLELIAICTLTVISFIFSYAILKKITLGEIK